MQHADNDTTKTDEQVKSTEIKSTEEPLAEQERLRKLYEQQQQRRACPGCGEDPFLG